MSCFTLLTIEVAGARVVTMSPSSVMVFSLRTICSSASLDCVTIFPTLRTSASSLANIEALWFSCFWTAATVFAKSAASLSRIFAIEVSSFAITICIWCISASRRGFSGPGLLKAFLSLSPIPVDFFFSQLFVNCDILSRGQFQAYLGACEIVFTLE